MNSCALCMVGNRKNIIGVGVAGDLPGPFPVALAVTIQTDMLGILVCCSVYHNKVQTEILAGLHDPNGDFAPVSYEYFAVHKNQVQ